MVDDNFFICLVDSVDINYKEMGDVLKIGPITESKVELYCIFILLV